MDIREELPSAEVVVMGGGGEKVSIVGREVGVARGNAAAAC